MRVRHTGPSELGCVIVGNCLLVAIAAVSSAAYFRARFEYLAADRPPKGGSEAVFVLFALLAGFVGVCLLIAWGSRVVRAVPWLRWLVVVGVALAWAAPLSCSLHDTEVARPQRAHRQR